jgi:hypothetical protein
MRRQLSSSEFPSDRLSTSLETVEGRLRPLVRLLARHAAAELSARSMFAQAGQRRTPQATPDAEAPEAVIVTEDRGRKASAEIPRERSGRQKAFRR